MRIKSIAAIALSALMVFGVLAMAGCSGQDSKAKSSASPSSKIPEATSTIDKNDLYSGKHHATIYVEGYDPIEVTMDADAAPITVTNFINLAKDGYYDGLTFYRVVEDFCLQGGTKGNNASGTDENLGTITGEFSSNGVNNPLADEFGRGTVAMARTSLPNSATSTFFITLADNDVVGTSLDGQYAAFGKVDENGMLVVDRIVADSIGSVDDEYMGTITNESLQPKITRIVIED